MFFLFPDSMYATPHLYHISPTLDFTFFGMSEGVETQIFLRASKLPLAAGTAGRSRRWLWPLFGLWNFRVHKFIQTLFEAFHHVLGHVTAKLLVNVRAKLSDALGHLRDGQGLAFPQRWLGLAPHFDDFFRGFFRFFGQL